MKTDYEVARDDYYNVYFTEVHRQAYRTRHEICTRFCSNSFLLFVVTPLALALLGHVIPFLKFYPQENITNFELFAYFLGP